VDIYIHIISFSKGGIKLFVMDIIWLNVTFQIEDALPIQVMHNAGIHILLISPILWPGEKEV
jgi:hypothetical protein